MHCTNCGKEIPGNATVCTQCGVAVGTEKKFCANCGEAIAANQAVCLKCGSSLPSGASAASKKVHPSGKSANTAAILSCLIAGLGQIYLGQTMKGVVMVVADIVLGTATFGAAIVVLWIIAIIDAIKIGQKLEAGQSVGEWEFF